MNYDLVNFSVSLANYSHFAATHLIDTQLLGSGMTREIERLSAIVNEVGRRDGIDNLRLNAEGTAALTFDNGKQVCFEYVAQNERLYVYIPLMPLPEGESRRTVLLESMLSCNFLGLEADKGEFAVSNDMHCAVYQIGLDVRQIDADRLDRAIDDLLRKRGESLYRLQYGKMAVTKPRQSTTASTAQKIAGWRRDGR